MKKYNTYGIVIFILIWRCYQYYSLPYQITYSHFIRVRSIIKKEERVDQDQKNSGKLSRILIDLNSWREILNQDSSISQKDERRQNSKVDLFLFRVRIDYIFFNTNFVVEIMMSMQRNK